MSKNSRLEEIMQMRTLVTGMNRPLLNNHQAIIQDEGVIFLELDKGFNIVSANKQASKFLGISLENLVGRNISEFVSNEEYCHTTECLLRDNYVRKKVVINDSVFLALILKNEKTNNYGEYLFLVE